jgi:hypothetical protein
LDVLVVVLNGALFDEGVLVLVDERVELWGEAEGEDFGQQLLRSCAPS